MVDLSPDLLVRYLVKLSSRPKNVGVRAECQPLIIIFIQNPISFKGRVNRRSRQHPRTFYETHSSVRNELGFGI